MTIMSIVMMVLTYMLIGFGFAAGFALFRFVAKKWRMKKRNKPAVSGGGRKNPRF
jgi:allophanate hydrolase subunit 1